MIVITGGAGFIGSNLVAGLEEKGIGPIAVCDILGRDDKWRNIAKRDLCHIVPPDELLPYLKRHASAVKAVFHMGAISSTTETDADLISRTNFTLSQDLWEWCAESGVRFIYASSGATYGDGARGFKDEDALKSLAALRPLNPYGWSKHLFDRWVSGIVHGARPGKKPPQWAGLKFFNVYGPNEYHKGGQMSVVCKIFPQVAAGAPATLFRSYDPAYEDGGQLRDFIYVGDCVDVMLWLYENPQVSGLFNVGTGKARSFQHLAEACFKAAGKPPRIQYIDMPEGLQAKYQYFTEADMTKLRAKGYTKPFRSLEEGIAAYVADHLSQPDMYK